MAARLQWLLTGACSPYHRHLDVERARSLVAGFLQYVLGSDSDPGPADTGQMSGRLRPWAFCAVRPDFLLAEEYDPDRPCPVYFGGCESDDTATLFYRDRLCYLLLTNGAP